jgi:hypothetical protein
MSAVAPGYHQGVATLRFYAWTVLLLWEFLWPALCYCYCYYKSGLNLI